MTEPQPALEPLRAGNYLLDGRGITWLKPGGNGPTEVPLTNFGAMIAADVRRDDGAETRREFEITARLNGRRARFTVPADRFRAMNWSGEHLGAEAIVRPGMGLRDHVGVAIQELSGARSGGIPTRHVFAHTGWRELPGGWGYLTASGAMMASGLDTSVTVDLGPALAAYDLPPADDPAVLRPAIRASLAVLDIAPDPVIVPLLAAAYRAPLPLWPDCSVWLYGLSGTLKTSLSCLAQQHFGAALAVDAAGLPGNWTSTANMLEMQAFTVAHALLVVDDYSPAASTMEARRSAYTADRLLRASANHAGRGRLNSDASMRPVKPPRAQILTSAEDLPPAGMSLRARVMVSEVTRGAVHLGPLGAAQGAAADGKLALAMSGYVQYLAAHHSVLDGQLKTRLAELRDAARAEGHPRTALNIASLMLGWEQWLFYAQHAGVIDGGQVGQLFRRAWKALCDLGAEQARYQRDASPADAYLRALGALLASGGVHFTSHDGGVPAEPQRWGWQFRAMGWEPQGQLIGWVTDDGMFLQPEVAYKEAKQFCERSGATLGVSRYALHQQLHARHLLAETEGLGRLTVRRNLGGRTRNVLHLAAASFEGGSDSAE
jgi:hypothetical protein